MIIKRSWLISDIHFGVKNNNKEWLDIQINYFYNYFIPLLKKHKKPDDYIFMLGDIFDNRQTISVLVMNTVLKLFKDLSLILPIKAIVGNHDSSLKQDNSINSLEIFRDIKNVEIITDYKAFDNILFIAWQNNHKKEIEILKKHSDTKYLFSHSEVLNTLYNSTQKQEHGNDISEYGSDIKIYSGHIHYRQKYKNLTYIGSPYQLTRSDINNTKGIYLLDLVNDTETFFENDYSPKFLSLKLEDYYDQTLSDIYKIIDNNFVDIYFSDKLSLKYNISGLLEKLSLKCRSLTPQIKSEDVLILDNGSDILNENTTDDFLDINNLLKMYLDNSSYDETTKSKVLKYINKIYTEENNL